MLPIALDAMGGDHAPTEVVRGAVEYSRATGRPVILVGREPEIRGALSALKEQPAPTGLSIEHAADVIAFGEGIKSIRLKRDSSIHVGARLVKHGRASAFVSAGHTGAVMAICKTVFGLIEGVDRPALPAPLPKVTDGFNVLLDAGANIDCRAEHFRQKGRLILGDALTKAAEDKPELIIDFATLTGAARVALGPDLPALFSW